MARAKVSPAAGIDVDEQARRYAAAVGIDAARRQRAARDAELEEDRRRRAAQRGKS